MLYSFGNYLCDTDRRTLTRAGAPLHLEPQVFDLLTFLIEHRERVVSREELHAALWPNQYVSDAALLYCIAEARKAVGDTGRQQRMIKTIYSRGYCFVAPVEERSQSSVAVAEASLPVLPADDQERWQEKVPPAVTAELDTPVSLPAVPVPELGQPQAARQPVGQLPDAERRQLTVLWCRPEMLSGRPEEVDPEDLYAMLSRLQQLCDTVMQGFDGYVVQQIHDGQVVYFGYPQAHEDDAARAIHAALAMLHDSAGLFTEFQEQHGVSWSIRLGIHTGMTVVGALGQTGTRLQTAVGTPPLIAAQVAQFAEPNTVVISAATRQLVTGMVSCRALGGRLLDNVVDELVLYQVLQASPLLRPLGGDHRHRLTPFVNREHDIRLLRDRWQQSKEGFGQVVILNGEPGIGKSRLTQVFLEGLQGDDYTLIESHCSVYHQHSALYPVITRFQQGLQWHADDTPQQKLANLEHALQAHDFPLASTVPVLASFLSLPLPSHYPSSVVPPEQQKAQTFDILFHWLMKKAAQRTLCLVVEDVHWIDPSTLEFLTLLINQAPTTPMLLLLTCRPTFVPPWTGRSYVTQLTLTRLPQTEAEHMLLEAAGGKALPAEVQQQVLEKTSGVPLFVEEMLKMVLEAGWIKEENASYELAGALPALTIPATLQASLMARLDHQGMGKVVAQWGATVGNEFSYALIAALAPLDAPTLQQCLDQLVQAEILYQRGLPPQAHYRFKHALMRDTAYQSLLQRTRRQYHRHIAQVLEAQFLNIWETQPEFLAHHYAEAGLHSKAIEYWYQAGQRASTRSAHLEAIVHLRCSLELVEKLASSRQRIQHELATYLALGLAYIATEGHAAPHVEQCYLRAQECSRELHDMEQLFTALRGLWFCYLTRSELHTAHELSRQLCQIAQQQSDSKLMTEAHRALGTSLFFQGDHLAAWSHLVKSTDMYDRQHHGTLTQNYGQDTNVLSMAYMAWNLWVRGYPDQALQKMEAALQLVQQLQHVFSLACTLFFITVLHQYRREREAVQKYVTCSLELATHYRFPLYTAMATILHGWVFAYDGQEEAGIAQMQQGVVAYCTTGADLGRTYMLALLAEVYVHAGRIPEALQTIAEALALVDRHSESWWEAELYRLQAACLRQQTPSNTTEIERLLQQAIVIAQRQHAKSLELRAVLDLSRHWQQQGKGQQARDLLMNIYAWFQEGFATPDLLEAKALLTTLA